MRVCNPKGTGTSASGVGVPVLVQHGPDVCPASLQALYNPALSPLPRFHGYRTNPSGLWKCSSVIQPLLLLQRLIEYFQNVFKMFCLFMCSACGLRPSLQVCIRSTPECYGAQEFVSEDVGRLLSGMLAGQDSHV